MKKIFLFLAIIIVVVIVGIFLIISNNSQVVNMTSPGPYIYKTNVDYSSNVHVNTKNGKIVGGFTSPIMYNPTVDNKYSEEYYRNQVNYSFELNDKYNLSHVIHENVRFLDLNYNEFIENEELINAWDNNMTDYISVLDKHVISYDNPFLELYDCKSVLDSVCDSVIDDIEQEFTFNYYNCLIENNLLNKVCKKII